MELVMRRMIVAVALFLALAGATPVLATIVNVGGGTWSYGSDYVFPASQNVYSDYVHPTKYHSATAICGSAYMKTYAYANNWAAANAGCAIWDSNAAYWNTY